MLIDPGQIPPMGGPRLPQVPQSPAFATTSYGPDSATTATGGGRGAFSYGDALNALIMNRLRRPVGSGGPALAARRPTLGGSGVMNDSARVRAENDARLKEEAANLEASNEKFAAEQPLPQRLATGMYSLPHYVADLQHMTPQQRALYAQINPHGNQAV